jgi:FtsP/CotA-like multicopper oxidase with cupredoxin domain
MVLAGLPVLFFVASALQQDALIPQAPRVPLPKPVAGAPIAMVNQNLVPAGTRTDKTVTLALDIVEAGYQPEGEHDPVVRILAFAEPGKAPGVPGPYLRATVGTTLHLILHNRTDSSLVLGGFRKSLPRARDTLQLAAGSTREVTVTLDRAGNWFYWAALKDTDYRDRMWLDSQLNGALIVDEADAKPSSNERIWLISEWFKQDRATTAFESALTFNGKAWPYNERLTFVQGDSIRFRIVNAAAVDHPLHLHGFYFRVTRHGGTGADTAVAAGLQPLQNMRLVPIGGSLSLAFLPTTPGNWVFHCHFASHIGEDVSLHGAPDPFLVPAATGDHAIPTHDMPGGHTMRGLVIGMHITPTPGDVEASAASRRVLDLLIQKRPNFFLGDQPGYGFVLQTGDQVPARDSILVPGPVLELKRGQPVRIQVHNNIDESSGVHWHGLEIPSYPDGVPGWSGIGDRIMPPIPPGGMFAAEFTPPRSGTFPYHAHLHELRQISSGLYGAIIVSDTPRDTTRDHLIVAGGGGLPVFRKLSIAPLMVNGSALPRALRMKVGETQRLRIVSIQADDALYFRLGTELAAVQWTPLAKDGADLPAALRVIGPAKVRMGPGETADFTFRPMRPGRYVLEVWEDFGPDRVALPIEVVAR